jgi:hypothetical protein
MQLDLSEILLLVGPAFEVSDLTLRTYVYENLIFLLAQEECD